MMSSIWKCQKGHSCKSQLASSQWGFLANFPCSQGEINANVPSMPPFSWKWLSSPFPSLPLRPPSEVLPPPAIHWFDTKALKLLYCGPLATCDWSRVWHMTQAGPIRALPWGFELGSRECQSSVVEAVRHEAGDCREPPLVPQEGSSSSVRSWQRQRWRAINSCWNSSAWFQLHLYTSALLVMLPLIIV